MRPMSISRIMWKTAASPSTTDAAGRGGEEQCARTDAQRGLQVSYSRVCAILTEIHSWMIAEMNDTVMAGQGTPWVEHPCIARKMRTREAGQGDKPSASAPRPATSRFPEICCQHQKGMKSSGAARSTPPQQPTAVQSAGQPEQSKRFSTPTGSSPSVGSSRINKSAR